MGHRDKKKAAVRARAGKLALASQTHGTISNNSAETRELDGIELVEGTHTSYLDSDCDYDGGINHWPSDTDSEWDDTESDGDSLEELEGDELKANLCELREEVEALTTPMNYNHIMAPKSVKDWKNVERNCTLGYTGTSQCTQQRRAQEARS